MDEYLRSSDGMEYDPPCPVLKPHTGSRLVVELGSGTGVNALALGKLLDASAGDVLVATDLDDVCPLLLKNLQGCTLPNGPIAVRPLCWGDSAQGESILSEFGDDDRGMMRAAHIVCSDLVRTSSPRLVEICVPDAVMA